MYNKTEWVPGITPLSEENLNNMEKGIADLTQKVSQLSAADLINLKAKADILDDDTMAVIIKLVNSFENPDTNEKFLCGDGSFRAMTYNLNVNKIKEVLDRYSISNSTEIATEIAEGLLE